MRAHPVPGPRCFLFVLATLAAVPAASATPLYTFTVLDVAGATATTAVGINDHGDIVGNYRDAAGSHGYVRRGGTVIPLGVVGEASGINNAGQVVGLASNGHSFLIDGSTVSVFAVPPEPIYAHAFDGARGINDAGEIVGFTDFMTDTVQGYWTDAPHSGNWGVFGRLNLNTLAVAWDINDAGEIVGHVSDPAFQLGFVLDLAGGGFTTFEVPGAYATLGFGINDAGHVVGAYATSPFELRRAFVRIGDVYTPLDVPGAVTSAAHGINEAGWIVGVFEDAGGAAHGFLAIPVSEPTSLGLLGAALAGLAVRVRTGRRPRRAA